MEDIGAVGHIIEVKGVVGENIGQWVAVLGSGGGRKIVGAMGHIVGITGVV